jgi:polyisoprenoid-binding protein YceI
MLNDDPEIRSEAEDTTSTASGPPSATVSDLAVGVWQLDPGRSTVEFHVGHFYGLMTVKGHFADYMGTLELACDPAVQLTIAAESLDTGHAKRDAHLRAADFFDVEKYPRVSFASESAELRGTTLKVHGQLHAAGRQTPVDVDATVNWVEGEPEIDAVTHVDHRALGMTWSPLGLLRTPSKLMVRGMLIRPSPVREGDVSR